MHRLIEQRLHIHTRLLKVRLKDGDIPREVFSLSRAVLYCTIGEEMWKEHERKRKRAKYSDRKKGHIDYIIVTSPLFFSSTK